MDLFSSRKQAPATVPGDLVFPIGYWNDQHVNRAISLDITLAFNNKLDTEKLQSSLETLLEKEGWRKFGARLRRNAENKLEYHIPPSFDTKRPSVLFTTDKQDVTRAEHPHFSRIPKGDFDKPTVLDSFGYMRPFLRSANAPEILDDWIYSDRPQLAVHAVVLKDATFITVTFIHTIMDAMGFSALLKGWTAVLRGKEDEIPPISPVDSDPMETIHQIVPSSKYVLVNQLLKGWGMFLFVFRLLFELWWYRKEVERMIFVPRSFMKELRDSALAELKEDSSRVSNGAAAPFLSESDVLLSWWTRMFMKALNPSPKRPVTLMNAFDLRGVLAELGLIPSADTALITNMAWPTVISTSTGEIIGNPVSYLASRIRHAIDTQRTKEQAPAMTAIYRETIEKTGQFPLFGGPGALLMTCTNWHRGKLLHMDFSAAIAREGVTRPEDATPQGKPFFLYVSTKIKGFPTRNSVGVMGKDDSGNWWFGANLRAGLWSSIEKQVSAL